MLNFERVPGFEIDTGTRTVLYVSDTSNLHILLLFSATNTALCDEVISNMGRLHHSTHSWPVWVWSKQTKSLSRNDRTWNTFCATSHIPQHNDSSLDRWLQQYSKWQYLVTVHDKTEDEQKAVCNHQPLRVTFESYFLNFLVIKHQQFSIIHILMANHTLLQFWLNWMVKFTGSSICKADYNDAWHRHITLFSDIKKELKQLLKASAIQQLRDSMHIVEAPAGAASTCLQWVSIRSTLYAIEKVWTYSEDLLGKKGLGTPQSVDMQMACPHSVVYPENNTKL